MKRFAISIIILSLLANVVLGFFLWRGGLPRRDGVAFYPFLSKRILQEEQNDILINFLDLRRQLRAMVAPYQDTFAFYFEYLPTGTSIGVNEKIEFSAASLIKVPIVMAYYHFKERTGLTVDKTVKITQDQIDRGFGELWKKGEGAEISLEEAARLSLVESDNTAVVVLAGNTPMEDFDAVYEGLDIDLTVESEETIITVKQYASVLKALYFSSVLGKDSSQKILELLTYSSFHDKLVAGIPQGVTVANKFGVLGNELFQDCGIVYVPRRPYVLCMVSHSNEDEARIRMKDVSAAIYDFVSSSNNKKR